MALLKVGGRAPDFVLPSQSGEMVRLSDYLGKNVVLYFYPKDFTAGCTAEAKAFRESYQEFYDSNTEVIGVSADSVETHERFVQRCGLPFKLLSDSAKEVREMYGASSFFGAGRVTYVIDTRGTVRFVFNSLVRPTRHVREALAALKAEKEALPKSI
ncbi:MAG: peroxiredoxin [Nitrososphaerota archaeon]|nr:peroxiredoxin [Nitrososphaerota archaeon]